EAEVAEVPPAWIEQESVAAFARLSPLDVLRALAVEETDRVGPLEVEGAEVREARDSAAGPDRRHFVGERRRLRGGLVGEHRSGKIAGQRIGCTIGRRFAP